MNPNATEVSAILYNTQQPKVIGRPFLYYNVKTLVLDLQDELQSFTYFQSDISLCEICLLRIIAYIQFLVESLLCNKIYKIDDLIFH